MKGTEPAALQDLAERFVVQLQHSGDAGDQEPDWITANQLGVPIGSLRLADVRLAPPGFLQQRRAARRGEQLPKTALVRLAHETSGTQIELRLPGVVETRGRPWLTGEFPYHVTVIRGGDRRLEPIDPAAVESDVALLAQRFLDALRAGDLDGYVEYLAQRDVVIRRWFPRLIQTLEQVGLDPTGLRCTDTRGPVRATGSWVQANGIDMYLEHENGKAMLIRVDDGLRIGGTWHFSDKPHNDLTVWDGDSSSVHYVETEE